MASLFRITYNLNLDHDGQINKKSTGKGKVAPSPPSNAMLETFRDLLADYEKSTTTTLMSTMTPALTPRSWCPPSTPVSRSFGKSPKDNRDFQ